MALAVGSTIVLLVLVTCGLFVLHPWWFPVAVSTAGAAIDHQFTVTFIACGTLLALAQLTMAYFVWRYRSGRPGVTLRAGPNPGEEQPSGSVAQGDRTLGIGGRFERLWAAGIAVVFLSLGAIGYRVWAQAAVQGPAAPNAQRVEVWGEQFAWYFRYPGPDGKFGPIHPDLMNDGIGNYLGLDREHDAAARDDIVTATLAVPAGEPVELVLRSKDVIHSFFVRELRVKQDAIPGTVEGLHFTAGRTGRYEIVCSELCGLGHYKMHADLDVMTADQFRTWLSQEAERQ